MAIRLYESWTSIIVNVESINQKYPGGILKFLESEFPTKKSFFDKAKALFRKPSIEDYDSVDSFSGVRVFGTRGCDGNLFYFSTRDNKEIRNVESLLMRFGLVSSEKSYSCDYYIFTKNDFTARIKRPVDWFQIDFAEAADSKTDQSIQFAIVSVYPFRMPYMPSKFKAIQGGISYLTRKHWEEYQNAIKENKPEVVFALSQVYIRYLNASLWKDIPNLDTFIQALITGNKSSIPSSLWYILDGSKEHDDEKRRLILYDDSINNNLSANPMKDKQILHDIASAWRTLDADLIIKHLAPEFQYDSMWVFESLDCSGYADYIRGKFDTIKRTGSKIDVTEIPDRNAIALSQDGKEPIYYIIKIEDGKIIKGDMTAFLF